MTVVNMDLHFGGQDIAGMSAVDNVVVVAVGMLRLRMTLLGNSKVVQVLQHMMEHCLQRVV